MWPASASASSFHSLCRQCRLLSVGRSSLCYESKGESAETLAPMRRIDELFLKLRLWYHGHGVLAPLDAVDDNGRLLSSLVGG